MTDYHIQSDNPQYIYFSRFLPTVNGGGGSRRLLQVLSELRILECLLISSVRENKIHQERPDKLNSELLRQLKEGVVVKKEYQLWSEDRRDAVYRLRYISSFWARDVDKFKQLQVAIVDDPIYFLPLIKKLRRSHIPIVASCHNIETLAPGQVVASQQKKLFLKELEILSLCELVITISREETILLNNLNIKTFYLPYYPVDEILDRLIKVREIREKTEKKHILLIGSVINIMTRNGMLRIIHYWKEHHLSKYGNKLLIAGYKADVFLNNLQSDNEIEFLGTLTNEKHDELLTSVKACLCYQEGGSGALTRICEMLIADVPVVTNSYAARSYFHVNGVIEFSALDDLENTLQKLETFDTQIPIPEKPDASTLRTYLNSFMK